jgi:hypothetical protein
MMEEEIIRKLSTASANFEDIDEWNGARPGHKYF